MSKPEYLVSPDVKSGVGKKTKTEKFSLLSLGVMFWLSVGWIFTICALAILADSLPLVDAERAVMGKQFILPFSESALLGTDSLGRDLLSRVIYGAQVSLQIAFTAPLIAMTIGVILGMSAGYFGGWIDRAVRIFIDSILAFPNIVAVTAVLFFAGSTMINMILVFGFFGIPIDTRIARANTLLFAQREFVTAARAQGASNLRILCKELFPNVIIPLLSLLMFSMSTVIFIEGSLAFLGLGIAPPTPTWGRMIAEGFQSLDSHPHETFVPSIVMFLTILSLNLIGDRLRAYSDVKGSAL